MATFTLNGKIARRCYLRVGYPITVQTAAVYYYDDHGLVTTDELTSIEEAERRVDTGELISITTTKNLVVASEEELNEALNEERNPYRSVQYFVDLNV